MKHGKNSVTKVGGAGRIVARVLSLILVGISFTGCLVSMEENSRRSNWKSKPPDREDIAAGMMELNTYVPFNEERGVFNSKPRGSWWRMFSMNSTRTT